jgi:glycosyltransferase involved in cell wall biosynthesis
MKVLIVTAMFPPIRTGTSFYSRNLASTLHSQGNQVTVVTVRNSESDFEDYPFEVIRINSLHVTATNYFKHLRFTSFYPSNYLKIRRIAEEKQVETILLINHYLDIAFLAVYAAKRLGLPLFISVGTQMQSLNPFRNKVLRFLDRLVCGRMIFPYCRNIISWDSEIERYIEEVQRKKVAEKSVIIPFGANGNIDELSSFEMDYSLKKTIVGVGAVISQRDYLFQIKVFRELLKHDSGIRLKIIGHIYDDAPVELAKKLGIYEHVEFLGEVPHERVLSEMKGADIHWMMLSGQYVGLGTATLEAMLLGLPSISNVPSNLFGLPDLVDMENYIYTDGISIDAIAEKINRLLNSQELRSKIGKSGKSYVARNLNWEKVGRQMIELFEQQR